MTVVVSPSESPPTPTIPKKDSTSSATTLPTQRPPHLPVQSPSIKIAIPLVRGNFPLVQLQEDAISDTVAASLASSLLSHVLFRKNQIPMPIPQLSRMKSASPRAEKLRNEMLDSFDTLASHLDTTFTALSTALARRASRIPQSTSRAYLAFVIGPSIGTAKSRVVFAVDGLVTKVWGQRDDQWREVEHDESSEDDDSEKGSENDSSDECDDDETQEPPDSDDDEDQEQDSEQDAHSCPPSPDAHQSTHAAEQLALRNANHRLMSALISADCDNRGLEEDVKATQTHVLIRAPRRFAHPAWIPRQNVASSMDGALNQFLTNSLDKKSKVEGVWVGCNLPGHDEEEDPHDENDEMIWWSWDGKFTGFTAW